MLYNAKHRLEGGIQEKPYLYLHTSYCDTCKAKVKGKYPEQQEEPVHVQMLYRVVC